MLHLQVSHLKIPIHYILSLRMHCINAVLHSEMSLQIQYNAIAQGFNIIQLMSSWCTVVQFKVYVQLCSAFAKIYQDRMQNCANTCVMHLCTSYTSCVWFKVDAQWCIAVQSGGFLLICLPITAHRPVGGGYLSALNFTGISPLCELDL